MRATPDGITAAFNDADRRLVLAAITGWNHEHGAALQSPAPLAYGSKLSRLAYINRLALTEHGLRLQASVIGRSRVSLAPYFDIMPILPLYRERGIVPPESVRLQMMRYTFCLIRAGGRFTVAGPVVLRSLRYGLEFGGAGRLAASRPLVYTSFPAAGVRKLGRSDFLVALRSTLKFWIAVTPEGQTITAPSLIPARVRAGLLAGPFRHSFRKLGVMGTRGGLSRVEWYFVGTAGQRTAEFENLMVLRVPKATRSCRVEALVEAEVTTPVPLQPLLGQRRFLRGARRLVLSLA
jgi:hypothetical protein